MPHSGHCQRKKYKKLTKKEINSEQEIYLQLYGIKVGEVDSIDLSFNTMIDRLSSNRRSQLGADFDEEQDNEKIPIYDVLVAGV